jgi:hypothetical protein
MSWRRALELAADSREAPTRQGVRWQPTNHVRLESPLGARREATQAGGGSQPAERHGLAAEVNKAVHSRKKRRYGGFSNKYFRTHYLLRSGDSIHVFG